MATTTPKRGRRLPVAEREAFKAERREEERLRIEESVRALMSSEGWERWARTRAAFHNYSLCNTLLIAQQMPEATMVAGYRTWQSIGRQVREGETGIRIMAPMTVRRRKDSGAERPVGISDSATIAQSVAARRHELGDQGGEIERLTLFRAVSVFDVSQTDGEELPELPREPIEGDSHAEYIERLEAFAGELGYAVAFEDPGEQLGGYCKRGPDGEPVKIAVNSPVIVCGALGLDTSGESIPYIARWGMADDVSAIRTYAAKVDECAARIERALGVRS